MKTRLLWALILSVGFAALYCGIVRPHVSSIPQEIRDPMADLKPVAPPPLEPPALVVPEIPAIPLPTAASPVRPASGLTQPEVPIQDRATIDFSIGAPVVRIDGKDKDALESALKEIGEVTKGLKIEAKK